MRIALAVFADFEQAPLGGPSQLAHRLGAATLLSHTLRRAARIELDGPRCLFVRPAHRDPAANALQQSGFSDRFELLALDDGRRPKRELIRSARKWNASAWRGSLLGTTWFDEFVEATAVARVLDHYDADAVLCLDGHQPLLDVAIAEQMLAHMREVRSDAAFVFTQAPPGLAGIILTRDAVRDLLEHKLPVGLLLSYRPETPRGDPIARKECARVPAVVAQTPVRLVGDTSASRELLDALLAELSEECDAQQICSAVRRRQAAELPPLPLEVELELTTDDPLASTTLRPRGEALGPRRLADPAAVQRLAAQLAERDDCLLVLAGHGDPLAHPQLVEILYAIRSAPVAGLAIVTPLVQLTDAQIDLLIRTRVDLVEAQIDAFSAASYRTVHKTDGYAAVLDNIRRLQAARLERHSPQPILIPSLTRCAATLPEVEPFFDHWIQNLGGAVIHGHSGYSGRLPADSLLSLEPPIRGPCRRLARRLTLLADGRAVLCSQDFAGEMVVGNWHTEPLARIWQGGALAGARADHARGDLSTRPLCAACHDWHRP